MTDTEALAVTLAAISDESLLALAQRMQEQNRHWPCTVSRSLAVACERERERRAELYLDAAEAS